MVSIVIVSHSQNLAQGVLELATQMTQGKVNIGVAAGVDDPEHPIGTDAIAIMQAIEDVYCSSGVLLMVDMGSAILSSEMALELIDSEKAKHVYICAAPIMEGTMSASVAAASGMPIDAVISEAHSALQAKYQLLNQTHHLAPAVAEIKDTAANIIDDGLEFTWLVKNAHGLHARPTATIVGAIASFDAEAKLYHGENMANAKSLNSIAVLGVQKGDIITLRAQGPDAKALLDAFSFLAQGNFGESLDAPHSVTNVVEPLSESMPDEVGSISGVAICAGIANGVAVIFEQVMPTPPVRPFTSQEIEIQRLHKAIERVTEQIELLKSTPQAKEEHVKIFEAHIMMLNDDELLDEVSCMIAKQHNVEQAVLSAISELAKSFRETSSEYMQAREADVWDIGRQLMFELCDGQSNQELHLTQPAIVFAEELSPSNMARLDPDLTLAICLSGGVPSSHSAVLAKAMGIPTLFKVADCLQRVEQGQLVCVDGFKGRLWYNPDLSQRKKLAEQDELSSVSYV
jgi:dihydroxyacetone kinase phosphotransfer subunit